MRVGWFGIWMVLAASSLCFAQDVSSKGDREQFPQSAKVARDRRAEVVLETARAQLRQKDYTAAMVALQELLDGPNAFASGGASVPSFVEEANRLLRELPSAARDAYERLHGSEANRLLQEAQTTGRVDGLREVVQRFGATMAGWLALRDLAARHTDRGEWRLAVAASQSLAQHPHSSVTQETGWIARWVLAEARANTNDHTANEWMRRTRKLLEGSPAPANSADKNLAEWLTRQWSSPSELTAAARTQDWSASLELAPSRQNVWQHSPGLDGDSAALLKDIVAEWEHYDVPALSSALPLVVGDVVIARFVHPAKVIAVDALRGKLLWEQTLSNPLGSTVTDLQRQPGIRTSLLEELQRKWFGDSVRGRLTTDGRRLFLVRDLDELDLKVGAGSRLRNHLEAWDLATGERRWRIGSSVNEPPTGFEGLYFLGPPLVSDGLLYVIAQRELQVSLWVLRASDGQLEWTLPLAETDRQQFKEVGWRHVACPVTWSGGRLICPTGAGCFVAVDPITRSLSWTLRFERDDIDSAIGFMAADRDRPFAVRWWESWREVACRELRVESRESDKGRSGLSTLGSRLLLIATPESRSLRALDSRTGDLVWRVKFAEPMFVATEASSVLVFERDAVTSLEAASGRELWHTSLSTPAGPGDWIGDKYVCPLLDAGWAMIDAKTGTARRSEDGFWWNLDIQKNPTDVFAPTTGRLVRVGESWAVQTPGHLGLFQSLVAHREDSMKRAQAKPSDVEAKIELARIAWQFRDWKQAEELLRPALAADEKVGTWLRETLRRRLLDHPAEYAAISAELLRLSSDPPSNIAARHTLIQAARSNGDLVEALRNVLGLLGTMTVDDLPVGVELPSSELDEHVENVLHVRRDRWAQGVIADLFTQADEATRQKLEALLAEQRQRAIDSPDAFALQTLADKLACLPVGREWRLQLSGRTGTGVGYLKTSLALREIAQGTDRMAAALAWYRLALLHDFHSEPLDAADCYHELRDRFADVKLADGRGSAEWLADVMPDSPIGRALSNGSRDPWPGRLPKITSEDELHDDIYCYAIPVESRDPFWRRLTVSVERQGRKVRFHGAGQRGFWDLPLPASNSPWRLTWDMHRGWGLGPVLLLQVGDDLFGIQPLDERGETNAKLLWRINVGPYQELGAAQFLPGRVGVRPDDSLLLDRYEQPMLNVVHASPGLICYRTRNRLIAIDPATGTPLWTWHNLPRLVSVTSDGEHVLVRLLESHQIEVRRGFDGKKLAHRTDDADSTSTVFEWGRRRVRLDTTNKTDVAAGTRLSVQDLVTGQTLWQRELPAGSVPLRVDESRLGVVEPAGVLRFVSLADGQELARHNVPLPKSLSTAYVFGDDLRLFVILSGPVTEKSWLATKQDRDSYRKPLANGWLHAFDRQTLRSLWTIPAGNLPIALEQPSDVPFLLLTYRRPSDDSTDGQNPDGVLHLIDKRTGKEVLYDVGGANNVYVTLEPDPLQQRLDLLTPKRRVRLDYADQ